MSYSLETLREVWNDNDKCDDFFEIGPDRDGLNLVEVRYKTTSNKIISRMSLTPERARLVAKAMLACADELEELENARKEKLKDVYSNL